MLRAALLSLIALASLSAQEMQPLQMAPTLASARSDWIRITNQRFQMSGKSTRVISEGEGGLTAVILTGEVVRTKQAKRVLLGKDEHALLFRSIVAEGFNRIVVRNPETQQEWAATLEQGKAVLAF